MFLICSFKYHFPWKSWKQYFILLFLFAFRCKDKMTYGRNTPAYLAALLALCRVNSAVWHSAPTSSTSMSCVQAQGHEVYLFQNSQVVFTLGVIALGMLGPVSRIPELFQSRKWRRYSSVEGWEQFCTLQCNCIMELSPNGLYFHISCAVLGQ